MWDDEPEYWNSPMDALTVNHSCVSLWVCPGAQCHDPAKVAMSPSIPFVKVRNFSSTKEGSATDLMISRKATSVCNVIDLGGVIEKSSEPKTLIVALSDPHLYAGHICLAYLKRHDIHIEKQSIATQKVPQNSQLLAEHVSRPVTLLIQKMMKESDNLYADCLFKKIGQERYGSIGSWKSGSQAVRSFLSSAADIDTSAMVVLDGSGLSRYNLVSPHQFVYFLQKMKTSPFYGDFLAALSLSGVDGTLKKALDEPELKGRVRAKSGGMKGVKTLCGYVKTKDGEPLAFSIMIGGFVEPRPKAHRLENEICKFLAGYEKNMAPCKE
jgi:D-alanyl-D-alanine carboxypeptidase/D-alanyl-D-alanine-endopeptidase (penicillin-binding protein 4)